MLRSQRNVYAVFMAHLAVEKALKGLYQKKCDRVPPKIHNLGYLMEQTGIVPPGETALFLVELTTAHITTRYPDDLFRLQKAYPKALVRRILDRAKETIEWIKQQL